MFLDQPEFFPEQHDFSPDEELSFDNPEIPIDTFTGIEFGLFPSPEVQNPKLHKPAEVGTGALLAYKTVSGTLDATDVLMGALSLGPLVAARLLKYSGIGAKLAPKVANGLGRLDNALTGGKVKQIIANFEKKMAERVGKNSRLAQTYDGFIDDAALTRISRNQLDPNFFKKIPSKSISKEIAAYAGKLKIPVKAIDIESLSYGQAEYMKNALNYFHSADDAIARLTKQGLKSQKVEKIIFEDFAKIGTKDAKFRIGYFDPDGFIHINMNEEMVARYVGSHGGDFEMAAWDISHHEMMHSVGRAEYDWLVRSKLGNLANDRRIYNEAHDLVTVKLMSKIEDPVRYQKYSEAFEKFAGSRAESEILEKAAKNGLDSLTSGELAHLQVTLTENNMYVAEWLALKSDSEVAQIINPLISNSKISFDEILQLREIYKGVMSGV